MSSSAAKIQNSFKVQGLAGKKTLKGSVHINGAKNSALKAMAAAVLFDGSVTLENIPDTADVTTMSEVLKKLGAVVNKTGLHSFTIDPTPISHTNIDADLAKNMRSSVVLTGPLLGRYGKATFPAPGGCVIGVRPIDLFLSAYEKLGATVTEPDCAYDIQGSQLTGTEITFNKISVGATETIMMAAVLLKGTTILNNCAREPEIGNVAEWLNSCGADISGIGTSTLTIQGTAGKLLQPKVPFVTIPDRIEAASYLVLAALCAEDMTIEGCRPDHMEDLINALKESGVSIDASSDSIRVTNTLPTKQFKSFNIQTREYPGIATDVQAPLVTFLTQAEGESKVVETIFEGRFKYVEDLISLGANITSVNQQEIIVKGPSKLKQNSNSSELKAHDIRAGFAVVLAALCAEGTFTVNNVHLIDRGYEKLEERLTSLGADVKRV